MIDLYDLYFMLFILLLIPVIIFLSIAGIVTEKNLDFFKDEETRWKEELEHDD